MRMDILVMENLFYQRNVKTVSEGYRKQSFYYESSHVLLDF